MKQNPLIGKTVSSVQMTADKMAIRFRLTDGTEVVALTDADCCSHTWIEHVSMPAGGFPFSVLEADDLDMPDLGEQPGHDVMAYYGFQIKTDKGHMVIDYRNDSNGYYGGSLCWPGENHYGGVYDQNVADTSEWTEITQDV